MNNYPKVSVIIPTYNRSHLIGQAINSILNQTYQNFEIIIIDGSPNDATVKVIRSFLTDPRIRYIHQEDIHTGAVKDRANIAKARNRAVKMARGKYIAPLDDDDFWCDEKKLEKQIRFLEEHPDYVLCGGGVIGIDKTNSRKISRISTLYPEKDEDIRKIMLAPENLVHSTIVFRKDAWETVGGYDEVNPLGEEMDLHLKLGKIGKMFTFREHFATYLLEAQEKEHIKKYGRNCIANGIRLAIKYRKDYPNFYKSFFFLLTHYLYSFFPIALRDFLKPIVKKVKKFFRKSINISEKIQHVTGRNKTNS